VLDFPGWAVNWFCFFKEKEMNRSGLGRWKWMLVLLAVSLMFGFGCVDVETDPEPPYPLHPYDYEYPEKEDPVPPWERPEDFPYVEITEPANGQFALPGDITVVGTYSGPELDSLTVNGTLVTLDGNAFSTEVSVTASEVFFPITAAAKIERGLVYSDGVNLIVGKSATPDSYIDDALLMDIENPGLLALSSLLSNLLDDLDLTARMKAALKEDKALFDLYEAYIGNIDISMKSKEEGLNFDVLVNDVELGLELLGMDLGLSLDGLTITTVTDLSVDSGNILSIEIIDLDVGLAHWDGTLPLIPDAIDAIFDFLMETIVPVLAETIIDLVLESAINDLLADLAIDITTDQFVYSLLPSLAETTDRNFVLGFDTDMEILEGWDDAFQPDGFRVTSSQLVEFGKNTPLAKLPYGLALALNDDMLNQLMYAVSATGALTFEISDPMMTAEIFSVIFFSFDQIPPQYPIVLELTPQVAPVFYTDLSDSLIYMSIPLLGRTWVDRGAKNGGRWEAMSFAVEAKGPVNFIYNDDSTFSLRLSDLDIDFRILHNAVGQKNIENMDRMFNELFGPILQELLAELEKSITIDIPAISGLKITIPELSATGPKEDYLGVFLDLQYQ